MTNTKYDQSVLQVTICDLFIMYRIENIKNFRCAKCGDTEFLVAFYQLFHIWLFSVMVIHLIFLYHKFLAHANKLPKIKVVMTKLSTFSHTFFTKQLSNSSVILFTWTRKVSFPKKPNFLLQSTFLQRCLNLREYVNFKVLARDCRQVRVNNILANSFLWREIFNFNGFFVPIR